MIHFPDFIDDPNGAICITTVLLSLAFKLQLYFNAILMTERWLNKHNRLLNATALLRNEIVDSDDYDESHMS